MFKHILASLMLLLLCSLWTGCHASRENRALHCDLQPGIDTKWLAVFHQCFYSGSICFAKVAPPRHGALCAHSNHCEEHGLSSSSADLLSMPQVVDWKTNWLFRDANVKIRWSRWAIHMEGLDIFGGLGLEASGVSFGPFLLASSLFGAPWSALSAVVGSTLASLPEACPNRALGSM